MSPITRRSLLASTAGLSALGLLAACGHPGSATTSSSGPATLSFTFWGPVFYQNFTKQMIDVFTTKQPNIKVQAQPAEWSGYWDKLATMVAGKSTPDVINMDGKYLADYGGRGVLKDLSTLKGLDLSSLSDSDKQAGSWNKKLYAASTGSNAFAVFANPSILAKAGVSLPDDTTWTWDDMLKLGKQVSDKVGGGVVGLSGGGSYADLTIFLRQHGEDLYSDTGAGFTPETCAKWLQLYLDIMESGAGFSASKATEDGTAGYEQQAFSTNRSAFYWSWSNQLGDARKSSGHDDIIMLRPPSTTGKASDNGLFLKASMFWSISSTTKNPEAAASFVNFLLNDPDAAAIQLVNRGVPSSKAELDAMASKLTPTDKDVIAWLEKVRPEIKTAPAIQPKGTSDFQNSLARELQNVRFKSTTPIQSATTLKKTLDSMTANAK
jgi:multiple sugar transport system substrate-binding protein